MTERAVMDLRLEIEAQSREGVFALANAVLAVVREAGLDGVNARYTQLRPAGRSRSFKPTIVPTHRSAGRWSFRGAEARLIAEVDAEGDDG